MSLIKHAKEEFKIAGYTPVEKDTEEGPNKWIQENVLELLEVFSKQEHSGSSASFCIDMFKKLAEFKTISPLTFSYDEFTEVHDGVYQNKRDSRVFKESLTSEPYFLYSIIKRDQKGDCWHGSFLDTKGNTIGSAHYIKDKTKPLKTFYIDTKDVEVSKGNWESYVVDESQLKEVFEYYNKKGK